MWQKTRGRFFKNLSSGTAKAGHKSYSVCIFIICLPVYPYAQAFMNCLCNARTLFFKESASGVGSLLLGFAKNSIGNLGLRLQLIVGS